MTTVMATMVILTITVITDTQIDIITVIGTIIIGASKLLKNGHLLRSPHPRPVRWEFDQRVNT